MTTDTGHPNSCACEDCMELWMGTASDKVDCPDCGGGSVPGRCHLCGSTGAIDADLADDPEALYYAREQTREDWAADQADMMRDEREGR